MLRRITFTPTLDTDIYAAGDVLFITTEIKGVLKWAGQPVYLKYVRLVDKDDQKTPLALFFFRSNVTLGPLNGTPTLTDANAVEAVSHLHLVAGDYEDLGGVSIAFIQADGAPYDIQIPLESNGDSTSIWMSAIVVSGTPTYTASGLVFDLWVEGA